jgi:hypothetical protein
MATEKPIPILSLTYAANEPREMFLICLFYRGGKRDGILGSLPSGSEIVLKIKIVLPR